MLKKIWLFNKGENVVLASTENVITHFRKMGKLPNPYKIIVNLTAKNNIIIAYKILYLYNFNRGVFHESVYV